MESGFLTCPICYEEFNSTARLPRFIPICGHTICSTCLATLLQNPSQSQKRCPLDLLQFPHDLTNIDSFKVNFMVKQILEMQSKKELCLDHNEEMHFACLTDRRKICNICVCEESHQGHKVKPLKVIKAETNSYSKKVKDILKNLGTCELEASKTNKELKSLLIKRVKDEFERMRRILTDKEHDVIFQITSCFCNQEAQVIKLIGANSDIRKSLESQVADIENIYTNQEFLRNEPLFKDTQQVLMNYKDQFDSVGIEEEREAIKTKLEELFQSFKDFLSCQVQVWSELKFSLEDNLFRGLCRGVLKEVPEAININNDDENRMETEEATSLLRMTTRLNFSYKKQTLIILTNSQVLKDQLINVEKWKDADTLCLQIVHDISDEEDISNLAFIWNFLRKCSNLFFNPKPFAKLMIYIEGQDLTHKEQIASLLGRILSTGSHLKDIVVTLRNCKVNKQFLQALIDNKLPKVAALEAFSFSLQKTKLVEKDICDLTLNLPPARCLTFSFAETKVTNKTLEWIKRNCSSILKDLEEFTLDMDTTKITDGEVGPILMMLRKVKKLSLDLASTKITNNTVETIGQILPNLQNTLEDFAFSIYEVAVTDRCFSSICVNLPKLNRIWLNLAFTKITDQSLGLLAQTMVLPGTNMDRFNLDLKHTEVTDVSLKQVFQKIGNVTDLMIDLSGTKVTDESVAPFILDKVMNMESLMDFEMNVSGTRVSPNIRSKIEELEISKTQEVMAD